jgi:hypothetical protein
LNYVGDIQTGFADLAAVLFGVADLATIKTADIDPEPEVVVGSANVESVLVAKNCR